MKTLEDYLIEKAVVIRGADSFPLNLTRDAHRGTKTRILEAMKAAISDACREQREICAAHYRESCDQEAEYSPSLESGIKNAPEPKMI